MAIRESNRAEGEPPGGDVDWSPLKVFINYRHDDTDGQALFLHDRLAARFGADNVFLDVRAVEVGTKWLEEIKRHGVGAGVFLAVIGRWWMKILKDQQRSADPDYVRFEIEFALSHGIPVVPVLVGGAVPPTEEDLAGPLRPLRPLSSTQVARLRNEHFDEDVAELAGRLERLVREHAEEHRRRDEEQRARITVQEDRSADTGANASGGDQVSPGGRAAIPREHLETIRCHMMEEGNLVPLLGPRLNAGAVGDGRGRRTPDAADLARELAARFKIKGRTDDLAEVAQYVFATRGRPDLYVSLREILSGVSEPGPVHRFLARFARRQREEAGRRRYQMIVSTNFDTALERAFDEQEEPYDLAVYMATGPDRGKFVHFPYGGEPEAIAVPNQYGRFPIGEYYELEERTVIVKIHGAVDGQLGSFRWRENYVITEDHYIDYLSRSPVESLVPTQILDKLRNNHCLFLGYSMRDWYVRVFLKRIWEGNPLGATSWAVEPGMDEFESRLWKLANVELHTAELPEYVEQLEALVEAAAPAGAAP